MKSYFVVLLAVSAVAAENLCTPGAFFKRDCNTCTCSSDGRSAACTDMACPPVGNANVNDIDTIRNQQKQICIPNSLFKESCNTCICSTDGLPKACTIMFCDSKTIERIDEAIIAKVCEPGEVYSPDGCNTCICNQYGTKAACTLRLCLPSLKSAYKDNEVEKWGPVYRDGDNCVPGRAFYSECNQCVCTRSGKSAFCTLMSCPASSIRN